MRRLTPLLITVALIGCRPGAHRSETHLSDRSPYADDVARTIKGLSPERMQGLLDGDGLGYAKAAELNGYPGPRHVLDLAEQLELTADQEADIRAAFDRMQQEARAAGRVVIEIESRLDSLFAERLANDSDIRDLTSEAGQAEARVRRAHLSAHLEVRRILSPDQIAAYNELRGYAARGHDAHAEHGS